ncbi:MAG: M23 family metallopeptidase [Deltaproteobacteria bacterium]
MKRIILALLLIALLMTPAQSAAPSEINVSFSSTSLAAGGLVLLTIQSGEMEKPHVTWMDRDIPLIYDSEASSWRGFLSADLNQKAGFYQAVVRGFSSGTINYYPVLVIKKNYGVRVLKFPPGQAGLSKADLKRVKREAAVVKKLWSAGYRAPLWNDGFILPVNNTIVGTFGKRSIINKRKRHPHSGVDIRGKPGDPVSAMHHGDVMLAADHFFTGKSIYLDHGGGMVSMYFHLDDILAEKGQRVEKGQIIGTVGATGRVTGPHLHWGVRVNNARVNPLELIELSREMEQQSP